MNSTRMVHNALEALAQGRRQPFFDLLSEDVSWEWFDLADLRPITGKNFVDTYLCGGLRQGPHANLGMSHVYDVFDDGTTIGVELTSHSRAPEADCSCRYSTWVFDWAGGLVTHVRAYVEPDN